MRIADFLEAIIDKDYQETLQHYLEEFDEGEGANNLHSAAYGCSDFFERWMWFFERVKSWSEDALELEEKSATAPVAEEKAAA
jgi:hypothetical protein